MFIKKLIAVLTAGCFLFSFVLSQPLHGIVEKRDTLKECRKIFDELVIPASYGRITDIKDFSSKKVVVNIQDLHCHAEVQRNISNILSQIDQKYKLKNVFIEGACGSIDTSWLTRVSNKELKRKIIDSLIDSGKLTGAEHYSVVSGRTDLLVGADNKKLHTDNLLRLNSILGQQKQIHARVDMLSHELESLKAKYYTSKNKKFEKLLKKYKNGKIKPEKYHTRLFKYAEKLDVEHERFTNLVKFTKTAGLSKKLNYNRIGRELQGFIAVLKQKLPYSAYSMLAANTANFSKANQLYVYLARISRQYPSIVKQYSNLKAFFNYLDASQSINPLEMIKEEHKLIDEIRLKLARQRAEREVVFLVEFTRYLKDYLSYKISAEDYDYISRNFPKFKMLWTRYVGNNKLEDIQPYMALLNEYYKVNIDRNQCLLKNCGIQDSNGINEHSNSLGWNKTRDYMDEHPNSLGWNKTRDYMDEHPNSLGWNKTRDNMDEHPNSLGWNKTRDYMDEHPNSLGWNKTRDYMDEHPNSLGWNRNDIAPSTTRINSGSKIMQDADEVVVLITGGFHTPGITRMLNDSSISYVTITPNVTQDTHFSEEVYTELVKAHSKILSESIQAAVLSAFGRHQLADLAIDEPLGDLIRELEHDINENELDENAIAERLAKINEAVNELLESDGDQWTRHVVKRSIEDDKVTYVLKSRYIDAKNDTKQERTKRYAAANGKRIDTTAPDNQLGKADLDNIETKIEQYIKKRGWDKNMSPDLFNAVVAGLSELLKISNPKRKSTKSLRRFLDLLPISIPFIAASGVPSWGLFITVVAAVISIVVIVTAFLIINKTRGKQASVRNIRLPFLPSAFIIAFLTLIGLGIRTPLKAVAYEYADSLAQAYGLTDTTLPLPMDAETIRWWASNEPDSGQLKIKFYCRGEIWGLVKETGYKNAENWSWGDLSYFSQRLEAVYGSDPDNPDLQKIEEVKDKIRKEFGGPVTVLVSPDPTLKDGKGIKASVPRTDVHPQKILDMRGANRVSMRKGAQTYDVMGRRIQPYRRGPRFSKGISPMTAKPTYLDSWRLWMQKSNSWRKQKIDHYSNEFNKRRKSGRLDNNARVEYEKLFREIFIQVIKQEDIASMSFEEKYAILRFGELERAPITELGRFQPISGARISGKREQLLKELYKDHLHWKGTFNEFRGTVNWIEQAEDIAQSLWTSRTIQITQKNAVKIAQELLQSDKLPDYMTGQLDELDFENIADLEVRITGSGLYIDSRSLGNIIAHTMLNLIAGPRRALTTADTPPSAERESESDQRHKRIQAERNTELEEKKDPRFLWQKLTNNISKVFTKTAIFTKMALFIAVLSLYRLLYFDHSGIFKRSLGVPPLEFPSHPLIRNYLNDFLTPIGIPAILYIVFRLISFRKGIDKAALSVRFKRYSLFGLLVAAIYFGYFIEAKQFLAGMGNPWDLFVFSVSFVLGVLFIKYAPLSTQEILPAVFGAQGFDDEETNKLARQFIGGDQGIDHLKKTIKQFAYHCGLIYADRNEFADMEGVFISLLNTESLDELQKHLIKDKELSQIVVKESPLIYFCALNSLFSKMDLYDGMELVYLYTESFIEVGIKAGDQLLLFSPNQHPYIVELRENTYTSSVIERYSQCAIPFIPIRQLNIDVYKSPRAAKSIFYNTLGFEYLYNTKIKNPQTAIEYFNAAVKEHPKGSVMAYNNLGEAYRMQGNFNRAEKMYKKALSIVPDSWAPTYSLGELYFDMANSCEKKKDISRAIFYLDQAKQKIVEANNINSSYPESRGFLSVIEQKLLELKTSRGQKLHTLVGIGILAVVIAAVAFGMLGINAGPGADVAMQAAMGAAGEGSQALAAGVPGIWVVLLVIGMLFSNVVAGKSDSTGVGDTSSVSDSVGSDIVHKGMTRKDLMVMAGEPIGLTAQDVKQIKKELFVNSNFSVNEKGKVIIHNIPGSDKENIDIKPPKELKAFTPSNMMWFEGKLYTIWKSGKHENGSPYKLSMAVYSLQKGKLELVSNPIELEQGKIRQLMGPDYDYSRFAAPLIPLGSKYLLVGCYQNGLIVINTQSMGIASRVKLQNILKYGRIIRLGETVAVIDGYYKNTNIIDISDPENVRILEANKDVKYRFQKESKTISVSAWSKSTDGGKKTKATLKFQEVGTKDEGVVEVTLDSEVPLRDHNIEGHSLIGNILFLKVKSAVFPPDKNFPDKHVIFAIDVSDVLKPQLLDVQVIPYGSNNYQPPQKDDRPSKKNPVGKQGMAPLDPDTRIAQAQGASQAEITAALRKAMPGAPIDKIQDIAATITAPAQDVPLDAQFAGPGAAAVSETESEKIEVSSKELRRGRAVAKTPIEGYTAKNYEWVDGKLYIPWRKTETKEEKGARRYYYNTVMGVYEIKNKRLNMVGKVVIEDASNFQLMGMCPHPDTYLQHIYSFKKIDERYIAIYTFLNGICIFDTKTQNIKRIEEISEYRYFPFSSEHQMMLRGNRLIGPSYNNELIIADVSNPANPRILFHIAPLLVFESEGRMKCIVFKEFFRKSYIYLFDMEAMSFEGVVNTSGLLTLRPTVEFKDGIMHLKRNESAGAPGIKINFAQHMTQDMYQKLNREFTVEDINDNDITALFDEDTYVTELIRQELNIEYGQENKINKQDLVKAMNKIVAEDDLFKRPLKAKHYIPYELQDRIIRNRIIFYIIFERVLKNKILHIAPSSPIKGQGAVPPESDTRLASAEAQLTPEKLTAKVLSAQRVYLHKEIVKAQESGDQERVAALTKELEGLSQAVSYSPRMGMIDLFLRNNSIQLISLASIILVVGVLAYMGVHYQQSGPGADVAMEAARSAVGEGSQALASGSAQGFLGLLLSSLFFPIRNFITSKKGTETRGAELEDEGRQSNTAKGIIRTIKGIARTIIGLPLLIGLVMMFLQACELQTPVGPETTQQDTTQIDTTQVDTIPSDTAVIDSGIVEDTTIEGEGINVGVEVDGTGSDIEYKVYITNKSGEKQRLVAIPDFYAKERTRIKKVDILPDNNILMLFSYWARDKEYNLILIIDESGRRLGENIEYGNEVISYKLEGGKIKVNDKNLDYSIELDESRGDHDVAYLDDRAHRQVTADGKYWLNYDESNHMVKVIDTDRDGREVASVQVPSGNMSVRPQLTADGTLMGIKLTQDWGSNALEYSRRDEYVVIDLATGKTIYDFSDENIDGIVKLDIKEFNSDGITIDYRVINYDYNTNTAQQVKAGTIARDLVIPGRPVVKEIDISAGEWIKSGMIGINPSDSADTATIFKGVTGFGMNYTIPIDLEETPVLNLTVKTDTAETFYLELKNSKDEAIVGKTLYNNMPKVKIDVRNTNGEYATISIDLSDEIIGTVTDKTATLMAISFNEIGRQASIEMSKMTFSSIAVGLGKRILSIGKGLFGLVIVVGIGVLVFFGAEAAAGEGSQALTSGPGQSILGFLLSLLLFPIRKMFRLGKGEGKGFISDNETLGETEKETLLALLKNDADEEKFIKMLFIDGREYNLTVLGCSVALDWREDRVKATLEKIKPFIREAKMSDSDKEYNVYSLQYNVRRYLEREGKRFISDGETPGKSEAGSDEAFGVSEGMAQALTQVAPGGAVETAVKAGRSADVGRIAVNAHEESVAAVRSQKQQSPVTREPAVQRELREKEIPHDDAIKGRNNATLEIAIKSAENSIKRLFDENAQDGNAKNIVNKINTDIQSMNTQEDKAYCVVYYCIALHKLFHNSRNEKHIDTYISIMNIFRKDSAIYKGVTVVNKLRDANRDIFFQYDRLEKMLIAQVFPLIETTDGQKEGVPDSGDTHETDISGLSMKAGQSAGRAALGFFNTWGMTVMTVEEMMDDYKDLRKICKPLVRRRLLWSGLGLDEKARERLIKHIKDRFTDKGILGTVVVEASESEINKLKAKLGEDFKQVGAEYENGLNLQLNGVLIPQWINKQNGVRYIQKLTEIPKAELKKFIETHGLKAVYALVYHKLNYLDWIYARSMGAENTENDMICINNELMIPELETIEKLVGMEVKQSVSAEELFGMYIERNTTVISDNNKKLETSNSVHLRWRQADYDADWDQQMKTLANVYKARLNAHHEGSVIRPGYAIVFKDSASSFEDRHRNIKSEVEKLNSGQAILEIFRNGKLNIRLIDGAYRLISNKDLDSIRTVLEAVKNNDKQQEEFAKFEAGLSDSTKRQINQEIREVFVAANPKLANVGYNELVEKKLIKQEFISFMYYLNWKHREAVAEYKWAQNSVSTWSGLDNVRQFAIRSIELGAHNAQIDCTELIQSKMQELLSTYQDKILRDGLTKEQAEEALKKEFTVYCDELSKKIIDQLKDTAFLPGFALSVIMPDMPHTVALKFKNAAIKCVGVQGLPKDKSLEPKVVVPENHNMVCISIPKGEMIKENRGIIRKIINSGLSKNIELVILPSGLPDVLGSEFFASANETMKREAGIAAEQRKKGVESMVACAEQGYSASAERAIDISDGFKKLARDSYKYRDPKAFETIKNRIEHLRQMAKTAKNMKLMQLSALVTEKIKQIDALSIMKEAERDEKNIEKACDECNQLIFGHLAFIAGENMIPMFYNGLLASDAHRQACAVFMLNVIGASKNDNEVEAFVQYVKAFKERLIKGDVELPKIEGEYSEAKFKEILTFGTSLDAQSLPEKSSAIIKRILDMLYNPDNHKQLEFMEEFLKQIRTSSQISTNTFAEITFAG